MNRIEMLVKIAQMLKEENLTPSVQQQLHTFQQQLLNNEVSVEQINAEILKLRPSELYQEWWSIISKKPIHKNLLNIINDKIENVDEIAKIVSSLMTQLIIRKNADPKIDLAALRFGDLLEILSDYYINNASHINVDKFKSIINLYKEIGIVKEEDTNASC